MKRILIVDDEVQILKALSRMFTETEYEIFTAQNSTEAMKLVEANEINMIISDMRMPLLDGYALLNKIKEKYPHIIRIILSGYADEKPMFRALLHNVAKLYVFKPWNNSDFLQSINKLFSDDSVLNSKALTDTMKEIGYSAAMPGNCNKMISLIEEENIDTLIEEIEQDPDISRLLLQVTKTAVYGVMPNKVTQAALYIGLHNLKSFMRWACVVSSLPQEQTNDNEPELILKHAYITNRIFLFLFEAFLHKQPAESAMFAGLLHNLGLIILTKSQQKNGQLKQSDLSANEYVQLELGQYEKSHQEIGAYLLEQWDLPFPVYEVALYHHRPLDSNIINRELVSGVHIAQAYAWRYLSGSDEKPVDPEVFEIIGTSEAEFEKRLNRYMKSEIK